MTARTRVATLVTGLGLLVGMAIPPGARAEDPNFLERASGAIGGFVRTVVDFIVPDGRRDEDLDRALETYAKGRYFTTWVYARRLSDRDAEWLRDESDLLAGLSAADAALHEEAVPRLRAVLDSNPVSPYYAVALASLLELEARAENHEAAADAAATYLADLWLRPRSPREAAIKAVFLETGNFTEEPARDEKRSASGTRRVERAEDRPTDRAVYRAGMALLRERRFEGAVVCFEALKETSPYYAYARYGLAQASYGSGDFRRARQSLAEILSHSGDRAGEPFLRDRAALLYAQILHELDEDGAAIRRLRLVSADGPFGLHAAILSAEIQAEREKPALALVYLKDRPSEGVEPKLVAQAAALDGLLHRDLSDPITAVSRLEEGIAVLDRYEASLRQASDGPPRLDELLRPLELRSRSLERRESWRRRNVSLAVPDLLGGNVGPGWGSRMLASLVTGDPGEDGYPVVYYRRDFDPFSALPFPREPRFEPPGDGAFPSLFRRSRGNTLSDALRHEIGVRAAMGEKGDPTHLALLLLDGELRLHAAAPAPDEDALAERVRELGFPAEVLSMIGAHRARSQVLLHAASALDPDASSVGMKGLRAAAREHLSRWRRYQRRLAREAVEEEVRTVQELRYRLEFELSQTLSEKRERETEMLQGAVPTSSLPRTPAG